MNSYLNPGDFVYVEGIQGNFETFLVDEPVQGGRIHPRTLDAYYPFSFIVVNVHHMLSTNIVFYGCIVDKVSSDVIWIAHNKLVNNEFKLGGNLKIIKANVDR